MTFILGPRVGKEWGEKSKSVNMPTNPACNMLLTVVEIKNKAKLFKYKTNQRYPVMHK